MRAAAAEVRRVWRVAEGAELPVWRLPGPPVLAGGRRAVRWWRSEDCGVAAEGAGHLDSKLKEEERFKFEEDEKKGI